VGNWVNWSLVIAGPSFCPMKISSEPFAWARWTRFRPQLSVRWWCGSGGRLEGSGPPHGSARSAMLGLAGGGL